MSYVQLYSVAVSLKCFVDKNWQYFKETVADYFMSLQKFTFAQLFGGENIMLEVCLEYESVHRMDVHLVKMMKTLVFNSWQKVSN